MQMVTSRELSTVRPGRSWHTIAMSVSSVRWALVAVVLGAAGAILDVCGGPGWVTALAYLGCYLSGGWQPTLDGLRALRARTLDVDLLMIVAALGAAAIGQVFDGALLIVIFATSGALEDLATRRTEESIRGLLDLAPDQATLVADDGTLETVAASVLVLGDVVAIRPGERLPADGIVIEGASDVDQASITGEPLPAPKSLGDKVFAGTLNGTGALRIRVDTAAGDTVVARIVAMVDEASSTKASTQLFIEKVERVYSVVVVCATLAVFAVPLAFGEDLRTSLLRAMTFMIVASPCAVVLATMPPLLAAMATASRHGVLVKSAVALEKSARISCVALDKTGTLTTGAPAVTAVIELDNPRRRRRDEILAIAAAAEQHSEHPVGRAIVAAAADAGWTPQPVSRFAAIPGHGVRTRVGDHDVEIVNASAPTADAGIRARAATTTATTVVVKVDDAAVGLIELRDQPRGEARASVMSLRALTGMSPILLTGDNSSAAHDLAHRVGIEDVRAGLLPEDKVVAVVDLRTSGHRVAVVGDGVNDAPALATADVGIAMGGIGSEVTLDTADIVIVGDDLTAVPAILRLAARARRIVVANLVIAATVIAVLVTWDIVGTLPLPLGVAGHEGSTILVVLNGLRLLSRRAWPADTGGGVSVTSPRTPG
ncbi:heavy metal translocating P-type ATPase [Gordonia sp. L191]|uniref:heavy metal translocating P-type ATPase n=1 Tax=Gordonia sp. L191 TaxID=2982699 RepID=UPI0024BFE934|nr:heavy metal translocating P-type ATPase [Gordonia sp. L191]WHU49292.1 heavy metal translocating P-type ATPase [Gordonia sp. L191]